MTPDQGDGAGAPHPDDQLFASHRARLFGIAYRMLGSRADAEDLVQDVYVHWYQSARQNIKSPIAFLVTITTRLCLDRLREVKRQRAGHLGPWLLEHVVEDHMPSPEMQLEFSEEVSIGFLAVLERLGPEERAAFLLHDVLDYEYREVAKILSKTESACRQTIHRARVRLRDPRARFAVTQESCERILKTFLATIGSGDREAVMASSLAIASMPADSTTRPVGASQMRHAKAAPLDRGAVFAEFGRESRRRTVSQLRSLKRLASRRPQMLNSLRPNTR